MKNSTLTSTLFLTLASFSINAMDMDKEKTREVVAFLKNNAPQDYELFKACAWEHKPHILVGIYAAMKDSNDMKEYWNKHFARQAELLQGKITGNNPVVPMKVKFGATNCFGDYANVAKYDGGDKSGNVHITTEDGTLFYFPGYFEMNDQDKYPKMGDNPLIVFKSE